MFLDVAILACAAFILAVSASHVEVCFVMSSLDNCAPARCLISVSMMMRSRIVPSWSKAFQVILEFAAGCVRVGNCLLADPVHIALGLFPQGVDLADVADGDLVPL